MGGEGAPEPGSLPRIRNLKGYFLLKKSVSTSRGYISHEMASSRKQGEQKLTTRTSLSQAADSVETSEIFIAGLEPQAADVKSWF